MYLNSTYVCRGCGAEAELLTCYTKTEDNEYAWRKRVGVIHKPDCIFYDMLVKAFPRLMRRIHEERSYGNEKAVA